MHERTSFQQQVIAELKNETSLVLKKEAEELVMKYSIEELHEA